MAFDFRKFCEDYGVVYYTQGHRRCRSGWVQIDCPFCSMEAGLGCNITTGHFNCYGCGHHWQDAVIEQLIAVDLKGARVLAKKYGQNIKIVLEDTEAPNPIDRAEIKHVPTGTCPFMDMHKKYLESRNFNPATLAKQWGVQGTTYLGEYKFRIYIPVFFQGKLVNFQCRDVTGKSMAKYKGCHKEHEAKNLKEVLYGIDDVPGDSIVVCEGPMDVWRLGPGAVATFGIDWKLPQAELLRPFKNRYILFDLEPQAVEQAHKLAHQLQEYPGNTKIIELVEGDPADMAQEDADRLMLSLKIRDVEQNPK